VKIVADENIERPTVVRLRTEEHDGIAVEPLDDR